MMICMVCGIDDIPENIVGALEHCLRRTMDSLHIVDFVLGDTTAFDRKAYEIICRLRRNYFGARCRVYIDREAGKDDEGNPDIVVPPYIHMVKEEYRRQWRDEVMLKDAELMIAYFPDLDDPAARIMERASDRYVNGVNLAYGNEIPLHFWNPMEGN